MSSQSTLLSCFFCLFALLITILLHGPRQSWVYTRPANKIGEKLSYTLFSDYSSNTNDEEEYQKEEKIVINNYFNLNSNKNAGIKILENKIFGAEAIIYDSKYNYFYTVTADGWLVRLNNMQSFISKITSLKFGDENNDVNMTQIIHLGGRGLGGTIDPLHDHCFYIAVVPIGLLYVNITAKTLRILSTRSDTDNKPICFADDVTVTKDGLHVYFTDASSVAPWIGESGCYDCMGASKQDITQGSGSGRLLEYDVSSGITNTLLDGMYFANGITLSPDESYLAITESLAFRVTAYWLRDSVFHTTGVKVLAGTSTILIDNLPGVPDNITPCPDGSGYWVAINTAATPLLLLALNNPMIGKLVAHLSPSIQPRAKPYTGAIKITNEGALSYMIFDDKGFVFSGVTSVLEWNDTLILGTVENSYIGIISFKLLR